MQSFQLISHSSIWNHFPVNYLLWPEAEAEGPPGYSFVPSHKPVYLVQQPGLYTPVAGRNEVPWAAAPLRHLELTCSQGKQVLKATHSVVAQLWPEAEAEGPPEDSFDTCVVFIPLVLIAVLVDPGIYDFPVVAYGFP